MVCQCIVNFLAFVGAYALGCYLFENLRAPWFMVRNLIERRNGEEKTLVQRFGKWAAVTGSTDGIGKAYAKEFARKGLNVVLISRTKSKLENVAKEIESEFRVQTKIIVADFSRPQEIYEHIEKELGELKVGILVNNVGQTTSQPGALAAFSADELWEVIYTNIGAVTQLSRLFFHRMQKSGVQGAIINVSSGLENHPTPYGAIYAASKAYNRSLTLALTEEARPYGITVQLVSPHFVVTKINSYSNWLMQPGLFRPLPDRYARWAVCTIGVVDKTTGYLWHGVENALSEIFPWRVRTFVSGPLLKWLTKNNIKEL